MAKGEMTVSNGALTNGAATPELMAHTCDEYAELHGKWVGLYGPNYIWTGKLARETENTLVLEECQQVYETREHSAKNADREKCSPRMIFPKTAICNIGETVWAPE